MNFLSASNKGEGREDCFEIAATKASWSILKIPSLGTISIIPISWSLCKEIGVGPVLHTLTKIFPAPSI